MPCDMKKYPADWQKRRERILERAGHKCERCGVPNHAVGYWSEGEWWPNGGNLVCDDAGRGINYDTGKQLTYAEAKEFCDHYNDHGTGKRQTDAYGNRWIAIVLTIAHLVPDGPLDCPDSDLQALCQKCHNALDAPMRARHRKEKAATAKACGSLFSGQEATP